MATKDFDKGREKKKTKTGHSFKLGGLEMKTLPELPPRLLVTYDQEEPIKGFDFCVYFLRKIIVPEDREKFETILDAESNIFVDMDDVIDVSNWLIGEYLGRPTNGSSSSSAGPSRTSDTSKETRSGNATT